MPAKPDNSDNLASLRIKLQRAAEASGLTQQQIGEAMGFDPSGARSAVSRLLNPTVGLDPRVSTLLAFAKAVKKKPGDLL